HALRFFWLLLFQAGDCIRDFHVTGVQTCALPIFSFNQAGRRNLVWQGFTLDNWRNPCGAPQVCEAFVNSIQVGLIATVVSTALEIGRASCRGRAKAALVPTPSWKNTLRSTAGSAD